MANAINLSTSLCSFTSRHLLGSKPSSWSTLGTCPAIFAGKSSVSNPSIFPIPDSDFISLFHEPSTEAPKGVTNPKPVITTLLI